MVTGDFVFLGSLSEFKAGTKTTWVFPGGRKPVLRMRCLRLKCHVPSWTSGSPALSPSSSGLGPRRLPSRDPVPRKQRTHARCCSTRVWRFQTQVLGSQPRPHSPGEAHPHPGPPREMWRFAGEGAPPRGPLLAVQHPSSGRGTTPFLCC